MAPLRTERTDGPDLIGAIAIGPVLAALAALAVLSVIPLRGHALSYLAGGPAIVMRTAVLLPAAAALSWRYVERPPARRQARARATT